MRLLFAMIFGLLVGVLVFVLVAVLACFLGLSLSRGGGDPSGLSLAIWGIGGLASLGAGFAAGIRTADSIYRGGDSD